MLSGWKVGSFARIWLLVREPAVAIFRLVALSARTGQPQFLVCAIVLTPAIIFTNYSCRWLTFAVGAQLVGVDKRADPSSHLGW